MREANIGKVSALLKLGKLEDAEKAALALLGNRAFKGEPAGEVYLLLGDIFHATATTKGGGDKEEALKKANGYYQNAFARFKAYPEIAAQGLLRSYKTFKELGLSQEAEDTLKILRENDKLENTKGREEAEKF